MDLNILSKTVSVVISGEVHRTLARALFSQSLSWFLELK